MRNVNVVGFQNFLALITDIKCISRNNLTKFKISMRGSDDVDLESYRCLDCGMTYRRRNPFINHLMTQSHIRSIDGIKDPWNSLRKSVRMELGLREDVFWQDMEAKYNELRPKIIINDPTDLETQDYIDRLYSLFHETWKVVHLEHLTGRDWKVIRARG